MKPSEMLESSRAHRADDSVVAAQVLDMASVLRAAALINTTNNNTPASQLGVYASGKGLA
jgi:hypothetical protein